MVGEICEKVNGWVWDGEVENEEKKKGGKIGKEVKEGRGKVGE